MTQTCEDSDEVEVVPPEVEQDPPQRGTWTNQLDFLLACVGYAVGLGNVWRFPYLCMKNGGGAFLIPYFFFLVVCGIPLFLLELAVGQFSSLSALPVWSMCPLFKGLGYATIISTGVCTIYYNMIMAWALYYLGHSFTHPLPWADCNHRWNSPACVQRGLDVNTTNATLWLPHGVNNQSDFGGTFWGSRNSTGNVTDFESHAGPGMKTMTPSEEFWQSIQFPNPACKAIFGINSLRMLELSSGIHDMGGVRWQLTLCLVAAWVIIFLCLFKGIKSMGKVVYLTVPLPYLLLSVLLIRGCMLPGSYNGIKFYLVPEFERLLHFDVWVEACIQIFFSLGPAWGTLITMSSFNRFHNNCYRDAILIPLINGGTSFYAGFVTFSVIGNMAKEAGLPVKDVITSGPGLAFIVYPEALTKLPLSPFWAVLFFLMLLTLGLDTQFGLVETVISGLTDVFPKYLAKNKTAVSALVCIVLGGIGIPFTTRGGMYLFQIYDWYCTAFTILLIAIMECLVLSYCYGVRRFCYDIQLMTGRYPGLGWRVCWGAVTPGIMMIMFVITCTQFKPPVYGDYVYPSWAEGVGWIIATVSVVPVPLLMITELLKAKGSLKQRLESLLKPTADWGPALQVHRDNYKYLKTHPRHHKLYTEEV